MMWDRYDILGFGILRVLIFWLFIILIVSFIAYVIYRIIKAINGDVNDKRSVERDKSLDILNERLAKGEITEEEYLKIKNILKK